jgi:hypothetical protein
LPPLLASPMQSAANGLPALGARAPGQSRLAMANPSALSALSSRNGEWTGIPRSTAARWMVDKEFLGWLEFGRKSVPVAS